ncbi:MAG TPA: hypothetical protein VGH38_11925, partial [Bryobacteraceae bacterium]
SGADVPTTVAVTYRVGAGSSYRAASTHVTLSFPAGFGEACGAGFMSSCNVGLTSSVPEIKTYSAKINHGTDRSWLALNYAGDTVTGMQLSRGLILSVNPTVANSLATGVYSEQVVVANPNNQNDVLLIDVKLLRNPGNLKISPASGSGSSETFTLEFPYPGGWQNLSVANLLINSGLEVRHACFLAYEVGVGKLHLTDDEGNMQGPAGSLSAGKSGSVANSQCTVRLISAEGEANLLKLTVNLTFSSTFQGQKTIYLAARDHDQNNSGWLPSGTWNVVPKAAPPKKRTSPAKSPAGQTKKAG